MILCVIVRIPICSQNHLLHGVFWMNTFQSCSPTCSHSFMKSSSTVYYVPSAFHSHAVSTCTLCGSQPFSEPTSGSWCCDSDTRRAQPLFPAPRSAPASLLWIPSSLPLPSPLRLPFPGLPCRRLCWTLTDDFLPVILSLPCDSSWQESFLPCVLLLSK